MAKNQTKPVSIKTLKQDTDDLAAIKKMADYQPANADSDYTVDKLMAAAEAMSEAADGHAQADADQKAARDAHVAAQWAFHNGLLGARQQVLAQYGDDSEQMAAVGLKKKSERKAPRRKNKAADKKAA